jgi:hypothetical protein
MARRYGTSSARFSQPDPYGGSYDFGDPQSLNRYAYTKNDPVNFRDPSGLELCFESWCTGGSDSYGAHVGWGTTGSYFGSYGNPPPGFSPHIREAMAAFDQRVQEALYTSRLREPQNKEQQPLDDCHHFAQMLQDIAVRAADVHTFLDTVASTFTAANDSSNAEIAAAADRGMPPDRPTFVDGGFKKQFQDQSNQPRHFVAGFIAGANLGVTYGLIRMNQHEEPNTHHENDPDIRLNAVSTDMGARYGANFMVGIGTIRREMVNEFVKRVCD